MEKATCWIWATVLVGLMMIIIVLQGCGTAQGVLKDVSWSAGRLADNITVESEK